MDINEAKRRYRDRSKDVGCIKYLVRHWRKMMVSFLSRFKRPREEDVEKVLADQQRASSFGYIRMSGTEMVDLSGLSLVEAMNTIYLCEGPGLKIKMVWIPTGAFDAIARDATTHCCDAADSPRRNSLVFNGRRINIEPWHHPYCQIDWDVRGY